MVTFLHAAQWPLACFCGWMALGIARRRKLSWIDAYALALVPGLLIALASSLFGPAKMSRNEQPWQGMIIWAAWSAYGVYLSTRRARRPEITRLNLSDRPSR
jgi:hypothetical protein